MMKIIGLSLFVAVATQSGFASATEVSVNDSLVCGKSYYYEPLAPSYLDNAFMDEGWKSNWFVGIGGGFSSFIGSPTGCGDFGKRTMPMVNGYLGKWFSPFAGCRLSFQGLKFKDSFSRKCDFQHLHLDFMYNVSSHFRKALDVLPKWDFIPYLGVGCWHNGETGKKPFAISAGLIGRYRVLDRLHLTGELGWSSTWADFDGVGQSSKISDHLLQANIGLSLSLGKNGWKKVIDAKPYMYQNEALIRSINELYELNQAMNKRIVDDGAALNEMKKILEIEGLLDKYNLIQQASGNNQYKQKNNYSGLNSLRERMRYKQQGGYDDNGMLPVVTERYRMDSLDMTAKDYFTAVRNNREGIGAPIYFFFKKGKADLTDPSQLINLDAIAKVALKYNLCAGIIGAADSKTGTAQINDSLSNQRATYITNLLVEKGMPKEQVFSNHLGGINRYEPKEANRQTCVILFFRKQEFNQ